MNITSQYREFLKAFIDVTGSSMLIGVSPNVDGFIDFKSQYPSKNPEQKDLFQRFTDSEDDYNFSQGFKDLSVKEGTRAQKLLAW